VTPSARAASTVAHELERDVPLGFGNQKDGTCQTPAADLPDRHHHDAEIKGATTDMSLGLGERAHRLCYRQRCLVPAAPSVSDADRARQYRRSAENCGSSRRREWARRSTMILNTRPGWAPITTTGSTETPAFIDRVVTKTVGACAPPQRTRSHRGDARNCRGADGSSISRRLGVRCEAARDRHPHLSWPPRLARIGSARSLRGHARGAPRRSCAALRSAARAEIERSARWF